jgi:hypothetical protein
MIRTSLSQFLGKTTRIFLSTFILIISVANTSIFADRDDFSWQDAIRELDTLPYSSRFMDSLLNKYSISNQRDLRTLTPRIPVCKNETLVYQVSWGPIFAGNLIITTDYDSVNKTIRIGGKAVSSNFVGAFYKMRDYVISTIDANGLYPLFFEQHLREGKRYRSDGWVLYDLQNKKAYIHNRQNKFFDTPQFTQDYLSVLHYIRNVNLRPGDTLTQHLFINKEIHPMLFSCKEKAVIETDNGMINTLKLVPHLVGEGRAFNKRDKLEVWLTDDSIPTPVLIKSKIKFGSVTAKLIWHNHRPTNVVQG